MRNLPVDFQNGFEDGEIVPIAQTVEPHKAIDDKLDAELEEIVNERVSERLSEVAWEVITRYSLEVFNHTRPEVTVTALAFAAGLFLNQGKSLTQLADELSGAVYREAENVIAGEKVRVWEKIKEGHPVGHPEHITKQALSDRIRKFCKQLDLRPSRGMKSEEACEKYKKAQLNKNAERKANRE